MAKQRIINTKFWSDPYIQGLSATDKLLYIYLLTNERTSICGVYEITNSTIAFDTGIDLDSLPQAMDRLGTDGKIRRYNNWIFLTNFVKNQNRYPM